MNRQVLGTAWYRFLATFRQRRGSYLAVVLLLALVGGVALGAVAGARRTQSSYTTYLASTNPSDLIVFTAFANPALGFSVGYDPATARETARLPYVRSQETVVGFDGNMDYVKKAHLDVGAGEKPPVVEGALGGEYSTQDRVHLVAGWLANPANPGEAVMNPQAAKELGVHPGSVIQLALNSDRQLLLPDVGTPAVKPVKIANIRMVGLVVLPQNVVEDEYDALGSAEVLLSPALTRELASCCASYSYSAMKLIGGTTHLAKVETEIAQRIPRLTSAFGYSTDAPAIARADRALKPESIALGVFGGLVALAALIIASQVIGRQLRLQAAELATLRALGAGPAMTTFDGLIGIAGAVIVGSALAVIVAIALSPLFPLGPVRPVYSPGVALDWTVLGVGFGLLVALLCGVSVFLAYQQAPHQARARRQQITDRPSRAARVAAASGLSVAAVTGIRFALERGDRRDAVPLRSAILGAVLAVLVVIATVTFGASLNGLASHPRLYGWNWDYALLSGFAGDEDLPAHQTAALLERDHDVAAASGVYFDSVEINGQADIPAIGATPNAAVAPPVLSGRGLEAPNQLVLAASTMAALHEHVGGTVRASAGGTTTRLVIAGTATMPAVGGLEMGIGAIVDYRLIPASVRNAQGNAVPGPNAFLIRTRGASVAALRSLQRISSEINATQGSGTSGGVVSVLRPAEISDSGSIEAIPTTLSAGLAAGALAALAITLVASVRRRRRDLAVLKTLGLSGRQLAAVIAWQSNVAVTIGVIVGVPLGIALGRLLWDLFASEMHAVPTPNVPVLSVVVIAVGAVVLATIVAALPGRIAARTPPALLLRAE